MSPDFENELCSQVVDGMKEVVTIQQEGRIIALRGTEKATLKVQRFESQLPWQLDAVANQAVADFEVGTSFGLKPEKLFEGICLALMTQIKGVTPSFYQSVFQPQLNISPGSSESRRGLVRGPLQLKNRVAMAQASKMRRTQRISLLCRGRTLGRSPQSSHNSFFDVYLVICNGFDPFCSGCRPLYCTLIQ